MTSWLGYKAARAIDDLIRSESRSPARSSQGGDVYPDERARQSATAQLRAAEDVDATHVEVIVLSGELRLSGSVASELMRQRAGEICGAIAGVTAVHNDLLVK